MRERPMLFSAPMVRAILAGSKTQTRRAVKLPHSNPLGEWEATTFGGTDAHGAEHPEQVAIWHTRTGETLVCPYGVPGDRLWVKETIRLHPDASPHDDRVRSIYAADSTLTCADAWPWKRAVLTSIHCPRGLSRILLEVTQVRVERLQEISEADSRAEGIVDGGCTECGNAEPCGCANPSPSARDAYVWLWNSINGAGAWDANPFVWAVTFKRMEEST